MADLHRKERAPLLLRFAAIAAVLMVARFIVWGPNSASSPTARERDVDPPTPAPSLATPSRATDESPPPAIAPTADAPAANVVSLICVDDAGRAIEGLRVHVAPIGGYRDEAGTTDADGTLRLSIPQRVVAKVFSDPDAEWRFVEEGLVTLGPATRLVLARSVWVYLGLPDTWREQPGDEAVAYVGSQRVGAVADRREVFLGRAVPGELVHIEHVAGVRPSVDAARWRVPRAQRFVVPWHPESNEEPGQVRIAAVPDAVAGTAARFWFAGDATDDDPFSKLVERQLSIDASGRWYACRLDAGAWRWSATDGEWTSSGQFDLSARALEPKEIPATWRTGGTVVLVRNDDGVLVAGTCWMVPPGTDTPEPGGGRTDGWDSGFIPLEPTGPMYGTAKCGAGVAHGRGLRWAGLPSGVSLYFDLEGHDLRQRVGPLTLSDANNAIEREVSPPPRARLAWPDEATGAPPETGVTVRVQALPTRDAPFPAPVQGRLRDGAAWLIGTNPARSANVVLSAGTLQASATWDGRSATVAGWQFARSEIHRVQVTTVDEHGTPVAQVQMQGAGTLDRVAVASDARGVGTIEWTGDPELAVWAVGKHFSKTVRARAGDELQLRVTAAGSLTVVSAIEAPIVGHFFLSPAEGTPHMASIDIPVAERIVAGAPITFQRLRAGTYDVGIRETPPSGGPALVHQARVKLAPGQSLEVAVERAR